MACGTCGKIASGAIGLTKFALGADAASAEVTLRRRDICRECPQATRNESRMDRTTKGLTSFSSCRVCSCIIAAKTALASERCPEGKW
jgi:hypothetical protein